MLTLTSDFGSPYPAAMKGVILSRTDARLIDIAHDLPRQDVRSAAFWLRETIPYFPPAIHLAVVDPGVGTDRRAIALRIGEHALVGPDNGLCRPVARALAASTAAPTATADTAAPTATADTAATDVAIEAFEITVADPASTTFHGRDVFAPAAADIHAAGVDRIESVGPAAPITGIEPIALGSCVDLRFPEPTTEDGVIHGEVLAVDDFGNVITNVPAEWLGEHRPATVVCNTERVPLVETFAAVAAGQRLVTVGSHGFLECAVNRGRGDDVFGLGTGDAVRFERPQ